MIQEDSRAEQEEEEEEEGKAEGKEEENVNEDTDLQENGESVNITPPSTPSPTPHTVGFAIVQAPRDSEAGSTAMEAAPDDATERTIQGGLPADPTDGLAPVTGRTPAPAIVPWLLRLQKARPVAKAEAPPAEARPSVADRKSTPIPDDGDGSDSDELPGQMRREVGAISPERDQESGSEPESPFLRPDSLILLRYGTIVRRATDADTRWVPSLDHDPFSADAASSIGSGSVGGRTRYSLGTAVRASEIQLMKASIPAFPASQDSPALKLRVSSAANDGLENSALGLAPPPPRTASGTITGALGSPLQELKLPPSPLPQDASSHMDPVRPTQDEDISPPAFARSSGGDSDSLPKVPLPPPLPSTSPNARAAGSGQLRSRRLTDVTGSSISQSPFVLQSSTPLRLPAPTSPTFKHTNAGTGGGLDNFPMGGSRQPSSFSRLPSFATSAGSSAGMGFSATLAEVSSAEVQLIAEAPLTGVPLSPAGSSCAPIGARLGSGGLLAADNMLMRETLSDTRGQLAPPTALARGGGRLILPGATSSLSAASSASSGGIGSGILPDILQPPQKQLQQGGVTSSLHGGSRLMNLGSFRSFRPKSPSSMALGAAERPPGLASNLAPPQPLARYLSGGQQPMPAGVSGGVVGGHPSATTEVSSDRALGDDPRHRLHSMSARNPGTLSVAVPGWVDAHQVGVGAKPAAAAVAGSLISPQPARGAVPLHHQGSRSVQRRATDQSGHSMGLLWSPSPARTGPGAGGAVEGRPLWPDSPAAAGRGPSPSPDSSSRMMRGRRIVSFDGRSMGGSYAVAGLDPNNC